MKGLFEFVAANYNIQRVNDTRHIPTDARELILFRVQPRPEPHSQEDHEFNESIQVEFARVKDMIYGEKK